jgi:hypothetical protein
MFARVRPTGNPASADIRSEKTSQTVLGMPTKSLECQIAAGQIGRYLAGEALSGETLRQLEAHVADCADCQQTIAERKQALMSMLGPGASTKAAAMVPPSPAFASTPSPEERGKLDLQEALRAAILKNQSAAHQATESPEAPETEAPRKAKATRSAKGPKATTASQLGFGKPLIYAGALALVLIGMGYASRSGLLLGPKAIASFIPATPSAATEPVSSIPTPAPTENGPVNPVKNTVGTPPPTASVAPNPTPAPLETAATPKVRVIQPQTEVEKVPLVAQKPSEPEPAIENAASEKVAEPMKPQQEPPKAAVAPKPAPALKLVARKRSRVRTPRATARRNRPVSGTIRVYDATGNPIR